jgi:hypothetical protein
MNFIKRMRKMIQIVILKKKKIKYLTLFHRLSRTKIILVIVAQKEAVIRIKILLQLRKVKEEMSIDKIVITKAKVRIEVEEINRKCMEL